MAWKKAKQYLEGCRRFALVAAAYLLWSPVKTFGNSKSGPGNLETGPGFTVGRSFFKLDNSSPSDIRDKKVEVLIPLNNLASDHKSFVVIKNAILTGYVAAQKGYDQVSDTKQS